MTYTEKGVDLSQWQGTSFNISNLKPYKFAILRAGYTGYGNGITKVKDTCFESYYKQCKALGIAVGAYWYSCANTRDKGIAEAKYMYENCLKGKQFEYPIYIDIEEYRYHKASKEGTTDAIIGFCETLEKLGYFVGVYANHDYFTNYIDNKRINAYSRWLAYWATNKPKVGYDYGLWQYTNNLNVNGVRIDGNITYVDYREIITKGGFNGYKKQSTANPVTYSYTLKTTKPVKAGDKLEVKTVANNTITVK